MIKVGRDFYINSANAADFLKHPEIGGAVVGAASLGPEEFEEILKIADKS